MLELSKADMIGKGLHRECFIHPQNPNMCIKVIYDPGGVAETKREVGYYEHLQKRLDSWKAIPQYYGTEETNFGTGYIFDLVRDFDGKTSKTLEAYLASEALTQSHLAGLSIALPKLKQALLDDRIITMAIKSKNILYQKRDEHFGDLVIVDNIGNSTLFPIATYMRLFAESKIERTWGRFIKSIQKENPANTVLKKLISDTGI